MQANFGLPVEIVTIRAEGNSNQEAVAAIDRKGQAIFQTIVGCFVENAPAIRVYESIGMRQVGTYRSLIL